MEEGGESPLDVLSRAATMVQENQQALATIDDPSKLLYSKQTTKWKRDRRSRLPEYTRKSDPKIPETFGVDQPASPEASASQQFSNGTDANKTSDTPIDMSVRQRGLPPSYSQTVNNPGYRSSYRQSVILPTRDELPSGISMCDPIIDEHFRRSLGNDYHTLFNNNVSKEPATAVAKPPVKVTGAGNTVIEVMMDNSGLSVDDHFAKALGETWTQLNKKEPEIKNNASENSLVSI